MGKPQNWTLLLEKPFKSFETHLIREEAVKTNSINKNSKEFSSTNCENQEKFFTNWKPLWTKSVDGRFMGESKKFEYKISLKISFIY